MKSIQFLLTILALSASAPVVSTSAFAGSPVICHPEERLIWCRDHHGRAYVCGRETIRVCRGGCAPEVESGNIAAVQNTLNTLAQSQAFAGATEFKAKVAKIAAETDSRAKFAAYLSLVGIENDPSNDDLMNFIGSRKADPAAVASLQKNAGLSATQATEVVTAISAALKGNLQ